jgi:biotin operon repressor
MWDCTLTSPRKLEGGGYSVPMSPKARRAKGESHWEHFASNATPEELKKSPIKDFAGCREFKMVSGKLACKVCDDGILRTVAGHDAHYRTTHEGLELYDSFSSSRSESAAGGRSNQNVPEGREAHRALLLRELKKQGVPAKTLHGEGYALAELKSTGCTLKELLAVGAYSLEQLCKAGVTGKLHQIKESGIGLPKLREAGYTLRELRLCGFTAKQLREQCEARLGDLKQCGYQLHDLKEAGYSLKELKELKRPGNGGADVAFTLQDFMKLGYSCIECKKAGYSLRALRSGYSEEDLKVTHFTTKAELAEDGFPVQQLKLAGFSAFELRDVGFKPSVLQTLGFTKADIKALGGSLGRQY